MADVLPHRIVESDPTTASTAADPLMIDAGRLAPLLSISIRTLRTWDAAGKLPAPLRVGGAVRWRMDEIRAWLSAGAPCREMWEARKASRK